MPIYEYECRKCGVFDYEQSILDKPLGRCPACRSKVTKLISAPAFHLKGGGWYADGYDKKPAKGEAKSNGEGTTATESAASEAKESAKPSEGKKSKKDKASSSAAAGKSSTT